MLQRCIHIYVYIYFNVIYVSVMYVWCYICFGRHVRTRPEVKGTPSPLLSACM